MSNASSVFHSFLEEKKNSGNSNTRRKYHSLNDIWSEAYNIPIFNELHSYILERGWNPFGFKGVDNQRDAELLYGKGPKVEVVTERLDEQNDEAKKNLAWTGFYVSQDISVAEGYRLEDGYLFRIYVEKASWSCIYKLPPGETMAGQKALDIMINAHKKKERFFSLTGPQDEPNSDPELSKPESIFIGSEVKKRILVIPMPKTLNSTNYNGHNTLITSIRSS